MLAGCCAAAAALVAVIGSGAVRLPSAVEAGIDIDSLARTVGLSIAQVNVTGHRNTADVEIFRALALDHVASQLDFDSTAARMRLEQLPWVRSATIQRVFPDGLSVHVVEREPYTIWRNGTEAVLFDVSGRELGPAPADADAGLPEVTGERAGTFASEILPLALAHAAIANRLVRAHRISDRRWRLELASGARIELPAAAPAEALARLLRQTPRSAVLALLDRPGASIDLRATDHIVIGRGAPASTTSRPAASAKPTGAVTGVLSASRQIAPLAAIKAK